MTNAHHTARRGDGRARTDETRGERRGLGGEAKRRPRKGWREREPEVEKMGEIERERQRKRATEQDIEEEERRLTGNKKENRGRE